MTLDKKTGFYILAFVTQVLIVGCGSSPSGPAASIPLRPVDEVESPDRSVLYLHFPDENEVIFLGKLSVEQAEKLNGSMMYPGYSAGSFIAGILTHAIVQSGIESSQEKSKIEAANKVLEKYKAVLGGISGTTLVEKDKPVRLSNSSITLAYLDDSVSSQSNRYIANVSPVYYVAQNERSLVLTNKIKLINPEPGGEKSHSVIVEYVSSPVLAEDPTYYWARDDYQHFIAAAKRLFIQSIILALDTHEPASKIKNVNPSTIRYYESGKKKVERGYVVEKSCDRIVFITLRNSVKSVPSFNPPQKCQDKIEGIVLVSE